MPPRWPCSAWVLLGAALLGGCLPRPQFKVSATDIGSDVTMLLARLWLADPDLSVNPAGGLAIPENKVSESVPFDLTDQIQVPSCAPTDMVCLQRGQEYSFGIDFPTENSLPHSLALLGLVAVSTSATTPAGGCLVGVTSGQVSLANQPFFPTTLTVSFLTGTLPAKSCISLGDTPLIAAATFDHTTLADGTELDIIIIDGWGFRPDLAVTVNTGCTTYQLDYATQTTAASANQILSVTPSKIIAQLAMGNLLETTCTGSTGMMVPATKKSVQVTVNPPNQPPMKTAVVELN